MAEETFDVDLDDLVPEPIRVKLKGVVYLVPGDIPAELYLSIQQRTKAAIESGDEESGVDAMNELYDMLLALFQEHQPDLESLPLGLGQMVNAVGQIYRAKGEPEEEAPSTPPRRPSATKRTSRARTPRPRPSASAS